MEHGTPMRTLWSRLLGDPVLHFAAVGAALFALHALVAPPEPAPAATEAATLPRIVIPAARVSGLVEGWTQAWGRPPSAAELDEMVEEEVRTEVLSREAQAQGLDRDDEYIRQHLRERLEILIDAGGATAEPTEAELEAFYAQNRSRFGAGPVVSFRQISLDPARRGEALPADAAALLARLAAGEEPADPAALGDDLDLPAVFDQVPEGDVASMFGSEFAEALLASAPGRWIGPLPSAYGQHLVRLDARAEASGPALDEVRESVREEWLAARVAARRDRAYRDLRKGYEIVVEEPAPPAAGVTAASAATAAAAAAAASP